MQTDKTIGWGIIGCGGISAKFAAGLKNLKNARLVAVAARDAARAAKFAAAHGFEKSYDSYEDLASDPEIDVVYIGTIHTAHMANSLLCIDNGKHVLCEKPFAINAAQAEKMIAAARAKDVFLMEAMWTRFLPGITHLRKILADNIIGEPGYLNASFGFNAERNPKGRLFDPALGGGALLDVGIYPISFASLVFGCQPERIQSEVQFGPTAVDERAAMLMDYGKNRLAQLACSINTQMSQEGVISGPKGFIKLQKKFWSAEKLIIQLDNQPPQILDFPIEPNFSVYTYQAKAVMNDIAAGKRENAIMPLAESLEIMKTLDQIREQWQFKYPCE
jgi:predicted dehydrogenase